MKQIIVAAVQPNAEQCYTEAEFRTKVASLVQKAAVKGVDVVVFPEDVSFWVAWAKESYRAEGIKARGGATIMVAESNGWRGKLEGFVECLLRRLKLNWFGEWLSQTRVHNIIYRTFSEVAKTHGVTIVAGSLYVRRKDGLKNVCPVFDSSGALVGEAEKVHLVGIEEAWGVKPGSSVKIIESDGIKIGACVCYDLSFPDVVRELKEQGAEFIAAPSAGWRPFPGYPFNESDMPQIMRARENNIHVVRPYQCGWMVPLAYFEGHTSIVDPSGAIIARSKSKDIEQIVICPLNID